MPTSSSTLEDDRLTIDGDIATILLDDDRAEYLGGQFIHATVASLDWGGMVEFFRTGEPIRDRPDRYRVADRAPDRPGHRGLLPGGARRPAAARRRPVARRPRRRRPLRRRALAHRDGPAVPGARARRRRVRGGLGRAGAGQRRGGRSRRTGSPSARPVRPSPARRASTTWPTSSTRCTSCPTRRAVAAGRLGGAPARWPALVLDWPLPTERGGVPDAPRRAHRRRPARRAATRARRSRRASSSWPGSRPRTLPDARRSSTCRRAHRCSSPSATRARGPRPDGSPAAAG